MIRRNYYSNRYTSMTTTNTDASITSNERITDPAIAGRISTLLGNSSVTARDREFVLSLQASFSKYSSLTQKQYNYFEVLEKRYDPATVAANSAARDAWLKSWDVWKQKQFKLCCQYYRLTPYFGDIVNNSIKDPNFIPSEKQFRAMCENKYAQRLIANMTDAKFEPGDIVQRRKQDEWVGTVVFVSDHITRSSANIGGRIYRVCWMTNGEEMEIYERDIKLYRNKG